MYLGIYFFEDKKTDVLHITNVKTETGGDTRIDINVKVNVLYTVTEGEDGRQRTFEKPYHGVVLYAAKGKHL